MSVFKNRTQLISLVLILVCSFVCILLITVLGNDDTNSAQEIYTVHLGDQSQDQLIERGHVMSADSVSVRAGASGVIVDLAAGGMYVEKGDLLLQMDSSKPEEWYEKAGDRIIDLNNQKQQVTQLLEVVRIEQRNSKVVTLAQLKLAQIKLELEETGISTRNRRLMDIDRQLIELDRLQSQEELDRQRRLLSKGLASQTDVNTRALALNKNIAAQEEFELSYHLRLAGATEEEILELQTEVDMQQFLVDKNGEKSAHRIQQLHTQIKVIDTKIAVEKKDMTISKDQIVGARSYAPRSGICLVRGYYDWRNAGRWVENAIGMKRHLGDIIMEIINPDSMEIEVLVSELDFESVRIGQKVSVRFPALGRELHSGEVYYIGGIGQDRKDASSLGDDLGKTDVTVFNTKIKLHTPSEDLRPGMSAVVSFIGFDDNKKQTSIYVPSRYVYAGETGRTQVQILHDGQVVERTVAGQQIGTDFYKVVSGLHEGDQLLPWAVHGE